MARYWGQRIVITGEEAVKYGGYRSADDFEAEAQAPFWQIADSGVGRAVLHGLDQAGKTVNVIWETRANSAAINKNDETLASKPRVDCGPLIPNSPEPIRGIGTGRGSDTRVGFDPTKYNGTRGPGHRADEILLHELVHSLRSCQGLVDCQRPDGIGDYDNVEEFYAVLLANIYMSEKGRSPLRADHHDYHPLMRPEEFHKSFLAESLIGQLWTQQRALVQAVAAVDCAFNPIRKLTGPSGAFPRCVK
jgi:hypothetical protein